MFRGPLGNADNRRREQGWGRRNKTHEFGVIAHAGLGARTVRMKHNFICIHSLASVLCASEVVCDRHTMANHTISRISARTHG